MVIERKMTMAAKTYSVTRKYPAEQFGNFDLSVKGLESREELIEELKQFNKIANDYKNKSNQCCDDFPNCSCNQPVKKETVPF